MGRRPGSGGFERGGQDRGSRQRYRLGASSPATPLPCLGKPGASGWLARNRWAEQPGPRSGASSFAPVTQPVVKDNQFAQHETEQEQQHERGQYEDACDKQGDSARVYVPVLLLAHAL